MDPDGCSCLLMAEFDPEFPYEQECECGHPYYMHFDVYDNYIPYGCRLCGCEEFTAKAGDPVPKSRRFQPCCSCHNHGPGDPCNAECNPSCEFQNLYAQFMKLHSELRRLHKLLAAKDASRRRNHGTRAAKGASGL